MVIIKVAVDGTEIEVKGKLTLQQMQEWVGGYIQYAPRSMCQVRGVREIICNEEGLMSNLPRNKAYPEFVGKIIIERR